MSRDFDEVYSDIGRLFKEVHELKNRMAILESRAIQPSPPHPRQPFVYDERGTRRFKQNNIVRFLLDAGPMDMNKIATIKFSIEDRRQFAQLIGYSVDGYADLSYGEDLTDEPD